jgi:hypothetical protein
MSTNKETQAKRHKEYFESDFQLTDGLNDQQRVARALEFIAYQLGGIRKELAKSNAMPRR